MRRRLERSPKAAGRAAARVRKTEWVILAFLAYAMVATYLLPITHGSARRLIVVNFGVILGYGLLIWLDSTTTRKAFSVARDWLPLVFTELAYQEMGWYTFARRGHTLERAWVIWDRSILRGGLKAAIEAFGPALPSVLEFAYSLTYALAPFSIVVLYVFNCRNRVDRFQFIFVLAVVLCCAQFPFWPSAPPRLLFFGEDFPSYDTVFRRFNWWLLGNWGIQTSVFPSAHVAGAFSAAFGMRQAMPEPKWVTRFLLLMAALIALATVYGRYHYAADAAAGFVMATMALLVGIVTSPGADAAPQKVL
jgi:membrane-associated phospholipid phosphatase